MSIQYRGAINRTRQKGGGNVVPYAATITPDPTTGRVQKIGPLTGNVTIAAPVNAQEGDDLTLVITQDATGGRTITWNAAFPSPPTSVTTANGVTVGKFTLVNGFWR